MDPTMETSVLKYLSAVNLVDEDVKTTLSLADCKFFSKVLIHLDESYKQKLRKDCSQKEILNHVKMFLEEYYTNTADVLNFDLAASISQHNEEHVKLELVKIAVALLCVGILDKNRHIFIEAALELETDTQEDILAIFKSVLAPDTGEMSLTNDLEQVLKGASGGRSETPVNLFQDLRTGDISISEPNSGVCTPQSQHLKRSLNTSYSDISSPFKGLEITVSSPSSFVDFIQSPQFVQKAILKQKDTELRRVRQQLNAEIILKEEHRLNAEELLIANRKRDADIERLQQRITELLAEKGLGTTVSEMSLKLEEAELEAAVLKEKVSTLLQYKFQFENLETENKTLTEECGKLQKEVSVLRSEHHAQKVSLTYMDHVTMQLEDKTDQVAELTETVEKLQQDKALLKLDLEVVRERLIAAKQNEAELENRLEDHEATEGETMSVVLDIQIKEFKKQLEELRCERDALLQQVSKSDTGSNVITSPLPHEYDSSKEASENESLHDDNNGNCAEFHSHSKLSSHGNLTLLNNFDRVCKEKTSSDSSHEYPNIDTASCSKSADLVEEVSFTDAKVTLADLIASMFSKSNKPLEEMEHILKSDLEKEEFKLFTDVILEGAEPCMEAPHKGKNPTFHISRDLLFQLWFANRDKDSQIRDLNMRIGCLYLQLRQMRAETGGKFSTDLMHVSRFFKKHGYSLDTILRSKRKIFSILSSSYTQKAKLLRVQKLLSEKFLEAAMFKRLYENSMTRWQGCKEIGHGSDGDRRSSSDSETDSRGSAHSDNKSLSNSKTANRACSESSSESLPSTDSVNQSLSSSECDKCLPLTDSATHSLSDSEYANQSLSDSNSCNQGLSASESARGILSKNPSTEVSLDICNIAKSLNQVDVESSPPSKLQCHQAEVNLLGQSEMKMLHEAAKEDGNLKSPLQVNPLEGETSNGNLFRPMVHWKKKRLTNEILQELSDNSINKSTCLSIQYNTRTLREKASNDVIAHSNCSVIGQLGCISLPADLHLVSPQLEKANAKAADQEKQVLHKEGLWFKAREANSTLSRTLNLERETVVKMKSRMETYVQKCQDLIAKLDTVTVQNTQNEHEMEKLRSELKDTQKMLEVCQEDLAQVRSLSDKCRKSSLADSPFGSSMSVSNLWQSCVLSESNTQTRKLLNRVNSAPALPRQNTSTASLQSVKSMIDQHSALLPNAMSCATEPDSPGCQWDTLSRLTGKTDVCDEKKPKRKGLSTLPENGAELKCQSQESPAKQDPNGPVYPPAESGDQFRLTSRQMVSPPHRSDLGSRENSSSSSVLAMSVDASLTSPVKRPQSVKVSKYTPAKRGGRKFHNRQDTRPAFLNLKK